MKEDPIIQEIRDWFDELFLWTANEITEKSNQLFITLWIEWFAEIVARNKKYGFNAIQKILADLVKLSFVVYSNVDNLPLQRKVILPEKNWSYKFIVTSLPFATMLRVGADSIFALMKEETNILFLVSTWATMHADIAAEIGLKWVYWEVNILGWAWIDIDHDQKILHIRDDSGSYGSCSNQFVEWMLQEYKEQGYTITIAMTHQNEFFPEETTISEEKIVGKKLELLHRLLVPSEIPDCLPKELSRYELVFEIFKQDTKNCTDPFDEIYITALSTFRDTLLEK